MPRLSKLSLLHRAGQQAAAYEQRYYDDLARKEKQRSEFIDVLAARHSERMGVSFEAARHHVLKVCVTANRRRDEAA
jgi:hypothetical protein